jgi:hypothetical protein
MMGRQKGDQSQLINLSPGRAERTLDRGRCRPTVFQIEKWFVDVA